MEFSFLSTKNCFVCWLTESHYKILPKQAVNLGQSKYFFSSIAGFFNYLHAKQLFKLYKFVLLRCLSEDHSVSGCCLFSDYYNLSTNHDRFTYEK